MNHRRQTTGPGVQAASRTQRTHAQVATAGSGSMAMLCILSEVSLVQTLNFISCFPAANQYQSEHLLQKALL